MEKLTYENNIEVVTACCESILALNEQEIYEDNLGLHIECCPYCSSSCNVELLKDVLIKNGTMVNVNGEIGMIYENDSCDTEELKNVNYSIILEKDMNCKNWNNKRLLLARCQFELV